MDKLILQPGTVVTLDGIPLEIAGYTDVLGRKENFEMATEVIIRRAISRDSWRDRTKDKS